tara:strand:- start:357 stop:731 length:375 start_codon:yes stop_codon:yes gene_type:complete
MVTNEIRMIVHAPHTEVFEFTVEPKNTKHWVKDSVEMSTDTKQINLGTQYSNEYVTREVTDYERDKFIELSDTHTPYTCSYSFRKISDTTTEIIFFESSNNEEELEHPLEHKHFEQLKELLEKN